MREPAAAAPDNLRPAEIHVGIEAGDLRGGDHCALQAAVDYLTGLSYTGDEGKQ